MVLRTPALRPGPVSVVLLRDGVAGLPDTTARVAAVVTRMDRVSGPAAGGTTVTVTGVGLAGATGWRFGTTAASCSVLTPVAVRCWAPAGTPGTAQVRFDPAGDVPFLDTPAGRWTWRS